MEYGTGRVGGVYWRLEPAARFVGSAKWVLAGRDLVFSERSRSLYAVTLRPSVCRLSSVTLVHPTQAFFNPSQRYDNEPNI